MSREAMKQALEALETNNEAWKQLADSGDAGFWEAEEQPFYELSVKAIAALRQALETDLAKVGEVGVWGEWQGLTADDIWKCNRAKSGSPVEFHICYAHQNVLDFAEAIEAKLREKNGG